MENNTDLKIIRNYSYEIIERITRFIIHLEEIKKQFYINDSTASDKLKFINSYKESLFKLLEIIILGLLDIENQKITSLNYIEIQKDSLKAINELHTKYLSILPRPIEPVELARFKRVIYYQILKLKEIKREISISINESVGEEISLDPLLVFRKDTINALVNKHNQDTSNKVDLISEDGSLDTSNLHITIPRIDASNSYRWSSLIHEMCHSLMNDIIFENDSIDVDYKKFISDDKDLLKFFITDIATLGFYPDNNITLKSWLTECWCDLFACILIGPAFYFSQYLAFLNEDSNCRKHPPALFRLYLIEAILAGRFPRKLYDLLEEQYLGTCENTLILYQNPNSLNYENCLLLRRVSNSFLKYFKKFFFASNDGIGISNNDNLNKRLEGLVKQYVSLYPDIIKQLVDRLNQGLPIPSIRISNNGIYEEIPTFIQEIFLASWMSRIDVLQPVVLANLKSYSSKLDLETFYIENIEKQIVRHDQAVLKSIQVSEWFDFYNNFKQRPVKINVFIPSKIGQELKQISGILVDHEIIKMILNNSVIIIPIMNVEEQIRTSSIDIRLGTSFQLFFPDQYGIIDFTDINNNLSANNFSKRINLDFIEGITITPGQFLLGHSMEYIKLPNYLCANLEGRSSFARLGIEIHMTAGFIDPGFEGVLTFEIYNAGPSTVKLYPGMRIAQMRLEHTKVPENPYGKKATVKYKGLLEHNVSRQSLDYEVKLISDYNTPKK